MFFIGGFLVFWVKSFRHPLSIATLIFFVIHSLVSHKELRFLFPLATLAPLVLILAFESCYQQWKKTKGLPKFLILCLFYFSAFENLVLLLGASIVPQRIEWSIFGYLAQNPQQKYYCFESPYRAVGIPMGFLARKMSEVKLTSIGNEKEIPPNSDFYLFPRNEAFP